MSAARAAIVVAAAMTIASVVPLFAEEPDATGLTLLTPLEMAGIAGGESGLVNGVCPGGGLEYVCLEGSVSKCFSYEGYCATKTHRLRYNLCLQLPPHSPHACRWYTMHCFKALKYEMVGGQCNNGDPYQACQGQYLGEWYIGDTKNACVWTYVPM